MRRLTASLIGFHENPESSARIIVPSQRGDEIGVAERELSDMQRDLVSMLHQKSRLAALGLAVSKINHDLRNLLASSQLLSDQLASVPDPRVQRFAPKLMRSLERAIAFCQSTLSYGRAQEAAPDRRMILVEQRGRRGARIRGACVGRLDHLDQRDRARAHRRRRSGPAVSRAAQPGAQRGAGAGEPARRATAAPSRSASPAAARVRSRSSRSPTPAPACPQKTREHLFEAFQTSGRPGGSGLGLAIAAELVRAHGGEIHLVEGTIGATFRIAIPDRPVELLTHPQRAGAGVGYSASLRRHSGACDASEP